MQGFPTERIGELDAAFGLRLAKATARIGELCTYAGWVRTGLLSCTGMSIGELWWMVLRAGCIKHHLGLGPLSQGAKYVHLCVYMCRWQRSLSPINKSLYVPYGVRKTRKDLAIVTTISFISHAKGVKKDRLVWLESWPIDPRYKD